MSFLFSFMLIYMAFLFVLKFDHLLSIFISLEFLGLFLFMLLIFFLNYFFLFTLFFLVITASESVLGLTLFVYFIRSSMKDYVYSFGILVF
ncbi:NADH dehydrogenase subunit 4L (mitochondrion) [Ramazzottius varieornatus]|uniref:NADH-ubiquinone oxidoreductase chain 4L n=1 Tax=Ramazzottius varieornatus TaxID=947166 RepID=A0A1C9ZP18_RAMVA|nr:NADH dehydrogenase subunit 4L [Ramazzottius varieornatus]BAV58169.1 NADH dehydrogenase subunit 4L [Ramazzottius varieornatus]